MEGRESLEELELSISLEEEEFVPGRTVERISHFEDDKIAEMGVDQKILTRSEEKDVMLDLKKNGRVKAVDFSCSSIGVFLPPVQLEELNLNGSKISIHQLMLLEEDCKNLKFLSLENVKLKEPFQGNSRLVQSAANFLKNNKNIKRLFTTIIPPANSTEARNEPYHTLVNQLLQNRSLEHFTYTKSPSHPIPSHHPNHPSSLIIHKNPTNLSENSGFPLQQDPPIPSGYFDEFVKANISANDIGNNIGWELLARMAREFGSEEVVKRVQDECRVDGVTAEMVYFKAMAFARMEDENLRVQDSINRANDSQINSVGVMESELNTGYESKVVSKQHSRQPSRPITPARSIVNIKQIVKSLKPTTPTTKSTQKKKKSPVASTKKKHYDKTYYEELSPKTPMDTVKLKQILEDEISRPYILQSQDSQETAIKISNCSKPKSPSRPTTHQTRLAQAAPTKPSRSVTPPTAPKPSSRSTSRVMKMITNCLLDKPKSRDKGRKGEEPCGYYENVKSKLAKKHELAVMKIRESLMNKSGNGNNIVAEDRGNRILRSRSNTRSTSQKTHKNKQRSPVITQSHMQIHSIRKSISPKPRISEPNPPPWAIWAPKFVKEVTFKPTAQLTKDEINSIVYTKKKSPKPRHSKNKENLHLSKGYLNPIQFGYMTHSRSPSKSRSRKPHEEVERTLNSRPKEKPSSPVLVNIYNL